MPDQEKRGCLRTAIRWGLAASAVVALIALAAFVVVFRAQLYRRYYLFPKQAQAWRDIRAQRAEPALDDGWPEFRGVMHAHSKISHDSIVTFPEIADAMNALDYDFIFLTDHFVDGKADYSLGWDGLYDGVLFVRGYEMQAGFMPWGLPRDTVFLSSEEPAALAKRIAELGGVVFIGHPEEPRPWDIPELTGMEIYNIHTDMKDEDLRELAPDIALSLWSYPEQTLRLIFDRPTEILARWDEMNLSRKFVGIAANDCHQNVGMRGFYTPDGTLLVRDTGHNDRKTGEWKLNFFKRLALRLLFGKLEPGKQIFRFEIDPYARTAGYLATHILARELTQESLLDSLRAGRVYVGFDMIADARGFVFLAESANLRAVMGETVVLAPGLTLRAASPYPGRFTILRNGIQAAQETGRQIAFEPREPGKYRVEVELDILAEWTPWIYSNPIEVAGR